MVAQHYGYHSSHHGHGARHDAGVVAATHFDFRVLHFFDVGGGLLLAYALGHWVLVVGAGISTGFARRVLESKGISNFSTYSKKAGGVLLIGVGVYLLTYLL